MRNRTKVFHGMALLLKRIVRCRIPFHNNLRCLNFKRLLCLRCRNQGSFYNQSRTDIDFGSGIKLTMGQAVKQKRQNGGRRAWPDMFIAEPMPRCVDGSWNHEYNGLFIELKKEGTRIKKKNGEYAIFMPYLGDYYQVTPNWAAQRTEWWNLLQRIFAGGDVAAEVAVYCQNANQK